MEELPNGGVRYRPRTEGLYASIVHRRDVTAGHDYWTVTSKDGLVSRYGTPRPDTPDALPTWRDPAVIAAPDDPDAPDGRGRIFAWKLTQTSDPLGNVIVYEYEDDAGRKVHYSVGFDFDDRAKAVLPLVPDETWQHALDDEGQARPLDKAGVVELTGLLRESAGGDRLKNWPTGMRIIARREKPHPGAQLSLFEQHDGWRYQLFATNTPTSTRGRLGQIAFLEARHRAQARVEDCIRTGKDTGLGHLPSKKASINQAWLTAAAMACDLLAWLRLLCLTGDLAQAEPKTLRYRILHTAARIIRGQRKRTIRIPETWPWARELRDCIHAALTLPMTI